MDDIATDQKAVAERLRLFRESLRLSQARFAEGVWLNRKPLSRERLASYEEGRAALPWSVFVEISWSYGLNAYWLATGNGFPVAPMQLGHLWGEGIHPQTSFLSAFQKHFAKGYAALATLPPVQPDQLREAGEELLTRLAQLSLMPLDARREVFANPWVPEQFRSLHLALSIWLSQRELMEAEERHAGDFARLRKERLERLFSEPEDREKERGGENLGLRTLGYPSTLGDVLSTITDLPSLMARLKALTSKRGEKRRLADELGVSTSSVSEWLSGRYEPDGKTTLRLLQWVQKEERKNKAPRQ